MEKRPLVTVVDDDESVRESLPDLLREFGFDARAFSSAEAFLASSALEETNCLVLDIAMPGMTGPDLHAELTRRGRLMPTIFITAQFSEATRRRLIEAGAVDCVFKPFSEKKMLDAIEAALRTDCP